MPPRPKHRWRRASERALTRFLARAVAALMRRLPLRWGHRIAHSLGLLVVLFIPRRMRLAMANIEAAFPGRFTPRERKWMAVNVSRNMAKVFVELFKGANLSTEEIKQLVPMEGLESIHAALERGRGAIILSAHLGNWEIGGARIAADGVPLGVIARDASDAGVAALINGAREAVGLSVFGRRDLLGMVKLLGRKGCLAILPDQSARKESVVIDFLGRPALTTRGPAVLALRTGAALFPVFCIRNRDDSLRGYVLPEIEVDSSPDREQAIRATMAKVNRAIEDQVRQYPDQWLWFHDRWKQSAK